MKNVDRLRKDRQKIIDAFTSSTEDQIDQKASIKITEQADHKAGRLLFGALLIFTLLSTIPYGPIAALSSLGAAAFGIIFAIACAKYPGIFIGRPITLLVLLAVCSTMIGCSPLLTNPNQDIIALCEEARGDACKYGDSVGYIVFGIMVQKASVDQTRAEADIESVFGTEVQRGYGLVSVIKISVYGS